MSRLTLCLLLLAGNCCQALDYMVLEAPVDQAAYMVLGTPAPVVAPPVAPVPQPAPKPVAAKPAAPVVAAAPKAFVPSPGMHSHICTRCRYEFWHYPGGSHVCPKCGNHSRGNYVQHQSSGGYRRRR